MAYFFPLLLYLGFGGGLLLLGTGSIPRLRTSRKPLSAAWVTTMTLLWALMPQSGRWVLSLWTPSSVAGGSLLMDLDRSIWWFVLSIGLVISGLSWVSLAEHGSDQARRRTPNLPLTGTLVVIFLIVTWLTLSGGSLLTTLAMWAVFDIIWFVIRLVGNAESQRVVWASAASGITTLVLWAVSIFLLQGGISGLWWLMRPSEPVLILLLVAAVVRIGFYPFQIIYMERPARSRPLTMIGVLNPVMGIALLYRLLTLPAVVPLEPGSSVSLGSDFLPMWVVGWGCFSVLWSGLRSLNAEAERGLLRVGYATLQAGVTGAVILWDGRLLLFGAGTWAVAMALLLAARRHDSRAFYWSWPTAIAGYFLLGGPPSLLGYLYRSVLSSAPWGWRLVFVVGLILVAVALLQRLRRHAQGSARVPWARQAVSLVAGFTFLLGTLLALTLGAAQFLVEPVGFGLWAIVIGLSAAWIRWGTAAQRRFWYRIQPLIEFFDMQWLYRAVWQGAEHLLASLRVTAEVVEGSGSILWSVLILLLVLMVLSSQ
jgi:hypothetical protein